MIIEYKDYIIEEIDTPLFKYKYRHKDCKPRAYYEGMFGYDPRHGHAGTISSCYELIDEDIKEFEEYYTEDDLKEIKEFEEIRQKRSQLLGGK